MGDSTRTPESEAAQEAQAEDIGPRTADEPQRDRAPRTIRTPVAIAATLVLLVTAGASAWWFLGPRAVRERTVARASEVDSVLETVWARAEDLDHDWNATVNSGAETDDVVALVSETTKTITAMLDSLEEASRTVETIESDEIAARYAKAIGYADLVLRDQLRENTETARDLQLAEISEQIGSLVEEGDSLLRASLDEANNRRYKSAKRYATQAASTYEKSVVLAKRYKAIGGDDAFVDYVAMTTELVKYADMYAGLADLGDDMSLYSRSDVNAYNAQIRKIDAQEDRIEEYAERLDSTGGHIGNFVRATNAEIVYELRLAKRAWDEARAFVAAGDF